ncbi:MAG: hypothetical protein HY303_08160 [Candidatus Wallbacteria bacterium]|nr:hypothetical protein [Candidatus Wallbacteria bacterium]
MRDPAEDPTPSCPVWQTIREAFETAYNNDEIMFLADLLGLKVPPRKAERVQLVCEAILGTGLDGPRLERLWARLDDTQQAAVSETLHGSAGFFDRGAFAAKYGALPVWQGKEDRWGRPTGPSLLALFLVRGDRYSGSRTIPRDLATRLKGFVPCPRKEQLQTLSEPSSPGEGPVVLRETERAAQQELFGVLRLVDMGQVQISPATSRPSVKGVAAIVERLAGGDFYGPEDEPKNKYSQRIGPIRAFAWPLLVQAAGLARASGTRLALTPSGRKALSRPAPEVLREVWDAWLRNSSFDEFSRVDAIKGQSDRKRLTAVAGRRAVIDGVLRGCPPARWIEVDELSRHMQASGAVFEVARDLGRLYISDAHYGSLSYAGFGGWSILQGRYLLALLFEYAATLGLVDVAYTGPADARDDFRENWGVDELEFLSRYDGLSCFRINALGAFVLGLSAGYEAAAPSDSSSGLLRVLPNLDVVTSGQTFDHGDEAFLAAF